MSATSEGGDPHEAEFDQAPAVLAEFLAPLSEDERIAGACQGSASPALFGWLARHMGFEPDRVLLDVGAGLGGPAAWAAREYGCRVIAVEPQSLAAAGARSLFHRLDVRDGDGGGADSAVGEATCDAVWSLAVLCTVADKRSLLAAMARAVRPGGAVGLLVYVAGAPVHDPPSANHFCSAAAIVELVRHAGLTVVEDREAASLLVPPPEWAAVHRRLDEHLAERARRDGRLASALEDKARFAALLRNGSVAPRAYVARRAR